MQKIFFVLFSFVIFNLSISAQDKANYNQKFTEGNYLILEGNFPLALKNLTEAYAIDSTHANISFKIGLCYLNSETEKKKALR